MGGKAIKLERYEFVFIDLAYLFVIREQGIASKQPGAVFSNPRPLTTNPCSYILSKCRNPPVPNSISTNSMKLYDA